MTILQANKLARSAGLEPATSGLEIRTSVQSNQLVKAHLVPVLELKEQYSLGALALHGAMTNLIARRAI